jgi:hypothetical protein
MKRRQFVLNILAGATSASIFLSLEKRTLGYAIPSQLLYGVRANVGKIQLFSLDLNTLVVQDLTSTIPEIILQPNERLSSFTVMLDGTFVVTTAPSVILQASSPSRLITFSPSTTLPTSQELDQSITIESLCARNNGELLSIISLNQGVPPFNLAKINQQTGEVSFLNDQLALPTNARFSNLTESPDGYLYTTYLSGEASTKIVQLFLEEGSFNILSQLSYNGGLVYNDLFDQAYSPLKDGIFVLANLNYQNPNSILWVNEELGVMELITAFAVDKIAFAYSTTPTSTDTNPTRTRRNPRPRKAG